MDDILNALIQQPLVGKIYATPEFVKSSRTSYEGRKDGIEHVIQTDHGEVKTPAHSLVIMGYDGQRDDFLILNSWGADWGFGGYLYVSSHLIFDVARPKVTSKLTESSQQNLGLPRKRQVDHDRVDEHVVSRVERIPSESANNIVSEKVRIPTYKLLLFDNTLYSLCEILHYSLTLFSMSTN